MTTTTAPTGAPMGSTNPAASARQLFAASAALSGLAFVALYSSMTGDTACAAPQPYARAGAATIVTAPDVDRHSALSTGALAVASLTTSALPAYDYPVSQAAAAPDLAANDGAHRWQFFAQVDTSKYPPMGYDPGDVKPPSSAAGGNDVVRPAPSYPWPKGQVPVGAPMGPYAPLDFDVTKPAANAEAKAPAETAPAAKVPEAPAKPAEKAAAPATDAKTAEPEAAATPAPAPTPAPPPAPATAAAPAAPAAAPAAAPPKAPAAAAEKPAEPATKPAAPAATASPQAPQQQMMPPMPSITPPSVNWGVPPQTMPIPGAPTGQPTYPPPPQAEPAPVAPTQPPRPAMPAPAQPQGQWQPQVAPQQPWQPWQPWQPQQPQPYWQMPQPQWQSPPMPPQGAPYGWGGVQQQPYGQPDPAQRR